MSGPKTSNLTNKDSEYQQGSLVAGSQEQGSTVTTLESNRDAPSTHRLAVNWRPIWEGLFKEFKDTQFVLYHTHGQAKVHLPENVDVVIGK